MGAHKLLDLGSSLIMGTTLVLFVVALFVKGLTHDLLLEAGVFLVSAKLVIGGYRASVAMNELRGELRAIRELLEQRAGSAG